MKLVMAWRKEKPQRHKGHKDQNKKSLCPFCLCGFLFFYLFLVSSYQFSLCQDMTLHCSFKLFLCYSCFWLRLYIQGIKFKEISMWAARRGTGTSISDPFEIVNSLFASIRYIICPGYSFLKF